MEKSIKRLIFLSLFATISLSGCVYFNTVYNANTAYEKGVESYQNESRQGRGVSGQTRQQFQKAIDKGKKILTEYPDSKYVDDAYILIGRSYYYLEQYGLARKYLSDLISDFPTSEYNMEARLFLGKAEQAVDELALARHEYEFLIENAESRSLRAQAYLALADLNKTEGKTQEMLTAVQSAIDNAEDNEIKADASWRTAKWAMENGEYDQAQEFYDLAAHYTTKPQFDRQIQLEIAQLHREEGDHELAKESVKKMLTDEDYKDLWPDLEVELGRIYDVSGDTLRAAEQYRLVAQEYARTSASAAAYYYLGEQAFARNEYDEAKQNFSNVKRMDNNSKYARRADRKIETINDFSKLTNQRDNLEASLIELYRNAMNPSSETDSTADDTTKSLFKGLIDNATEEKYSFQDAYPWISQQDTLESFNEYLEVLFQIVEYYYYDLGQPQVANTLADSLVNMASNNEFKAKVRALQAQVARRVTRQPERAQQIETDILNNYPETSIAKHLDGSEPQVMRDSLFIDGKPLVDKYDEADSLITQGEYEKAVEYLRKIHAEFPESKYGIKAQYGIAWLYDSRLMQLDSATANYQQFQEEYPDNNMTPEVQQRLSKLKSVQANLAKADALEQPAESVQQSGNEFQTATPDTTLSNTLPEEVTQDTTSTEEPNKKLKTPAIFKRSNQIDDPDTNNTHLKKLEEQAP